MDAKVIAALIIGMAVGAASASALTPSRNGVAVVPAPAPATAVWSAEHAAIPRDTEARDPAPTF